MSTRKTGFILLSLALLVCRDGLGVSTHAERARELTQRARTEKEISTSHVTNLESCRFFDNRHAPEDEAVLNDSGQVTGNRGLVYDTNRLARHLMTLLAPAIARLANRHRENSPEPLAAQLTQLLEPGQIAKMEDEAYEKRRRETRDRLAENQAKLGSLESSARYRAKMAAFETEFFAAAPVGKRVDALSAERESVARDLNTKKNERLRMKNLGQPLALKEQEIEGLEQKLRDATDAIRDFRRDVLEDLPTEKGVRRAASEIDGLEAWLASHAEALRSYREAVRTLAEARDLTKQRSSIIETFYSEADEHVRAKQLLHLWARLPDRGVKFAFLLQGDRTPSGDWSADVFSAQLFEFSAETEAMKGKVVLPVLREKWPEGDRRQGATVGAELKVGASDRVRWMKCSAPVFDEGAIAAFKKRLRDDEGLPVTDGSAKT